MVLIYTEPSEKVRQVLNYEMKKMFERYGITYPQFLESYSYYMGDAVVSKKIISNITNKLIVLEAEHSKNKLSNSRNYEYFKQYFTYKTNKITNTLMIE
jgi:hypothetical protein